MRESPPIYLSDLKDGQSAVVESLDLPEETLWKLMEMGFGKGRPLRVVRRAPLGDPLEVEILGYRLALRLSEAKGIRLREMGGFRKRRRTRMRGRPS